MPAQDHIGLTGPEYEMDVERGHIRRFARAMSAPLPEFVEGRKPVIPATFLVSAPYTWGYSLERPRGTEFADIDHDLSVSLHAEEAFVFHGPPPRGGDRLICRSTLESVTTKAGGRGGDLTFLTVLTEYRDPDRRLRVEQRSTSVTTAVAPSEGDWEVDLPDYAPDYPNKDPDNYFAGIERRQWDDLAAGQGPGEISGAVLQLGDIVRFQGVVGEDDALHHDTVWAAKFGYPSVFGLGTHLASLLAGYAASWLQPSAVRAFRARFHNVSWPGDSLRYRGVVARKYRDAGEQRMADLRLECLRENGEMLVEAWMTLNFDDG